MKSVAVTVLEKAITRRKVQLARYEPSVHRTVEDEARIRVLVTEVEQLQEAVTKLVLENREEKV